MKKLVKKYIDGLLESDLAEIVVPPNKFIAGHDFRIGTTDIGGVGYIENILETAEKAHTLPSGGINTRIGFATDDENGFIIKFVDNSNGDDRIDLYDIVGDVWYTVLRGGDVVGGLNFNKYYLINGAFVINGILYWNDNLNEPRSLHLGAFMSAYGASPLPSPVDTDFVVTLPVDYTEITLIKKGADIPATITKEYDSSFINNFIGNDSYQFAVQWKYYTGEESVLNNWSQSSFINAPDDDSNFIRVIVDGTETMPNAVRFVRLFVKPASTGKAFEVKSWDRLVAAEAADINSQTMSYLFYGNLNGEPIDSPSQVRPFYTVPLLSGTMANAKNRVILSDNTEGYDTPLSTSLGFSLTSQSTAGVSSISVRLLEIRMRFGVPGPDNDYNYGGYYVYLSTSDGVPTTGYYLINGTEQIHVTGSIFNNYLTDPALGAAPTSATTGTMTYRGATLAAVQTAVGLVFTPGNNDGTFVYPRTLISIMGLTVVVYNNLKSGSDYRIGVVFFDRYLRKCGVVPYDAVVSIPKRNYALSSIYTSINWTLGISSILDEIPEWAYYYSVVRTLNLRTRYFVQSFDEAAKYATRDSDGLLVFTSDTFTIGTVAIAINSDALLQSNLGWVYEQKNQDQCILIDNANNVYELPVIGQEGEYILLKPQDIGDLSTKTFVYELYVPYKSSVQEPFWEMGEMYKIENPGTALRTYETLSGVFRFDAFSFTRTYNSTGYLVEAMNPNDVYFDRWDTDAGRPNYIIKLGQKRYNTGIRFSNVIVDETQTNGLSAFEALNRENLPEDMGTITKLCQVAKVQKDGNVLLAIGEQENASIYLGETEVTDTEGNIFLAKSDKFIGQINILKGGFGCSNHESVVTYKGFAWWFSLTKGRFVSYANNGIYPISDNGLKRVANLFSKKYSSLSVAEIEALGSRPFVFGGVDPYHQEVYFSIPATESTPPKGYVPSYESPDLPIIYPFDVYDGVAKVLVYKLMADQWGAPHSYETEGFADIRDFLFSAKNGELHKHNVNNGTVNTFSKFYGVQVIPAIGLIVNENVNFVAEFVTLNIEGNTQPTFVMFLTETPNQQVSDISSDASEWIVREGIVYSRYGIRRDRLSPNVSGTYDAKLWTGDKMRGNWCKILLEFETTELLQIRFFNIGTVLHDRANT